MPGPPYVGQNEDMARRVEQNNDPARDQAKYTRAHAGAWTPVGSEPLADRASPMPVNAQSKR